MYVVIQMSVCNNYIFLRVFDVFYASKRKPLPPFDSADSVPSLGHPSPGSCKILSL